jgi:hypothetical protein
MSLVYVSPSLHDSWLPLDLHGRSRDFPASKAWEASRHEVHIQYSLLYQLRNNERCEILTCDVHIND